MDIDAWPMVIDADAVGHELLRDPGVRGRILERFGRGVLPAPGPEDGRRTEPPIDRRALGAIVFAAARIKVRAIGRPRQTNVSVGNAQRRPLHRLRLLNIENKNVFAGLRRNSLALDVIVAVIAAGEDQQCAAVRAYGR